MYFKTLIVAYTSLLSLGIAERPSLRHSPPSDIAATPKEHATDGSEKFRGHEGISIALGDASHDHGHSPKPTHTFIKRSAFGVYECKNRDWGGPRTWTQADGGACHNWIYGKGGSMGPDRGIVCRIYKAENCNDNGFHLDNFQMPGFANYATNVWLKENGMTNGPASYKCRLA